MADFTDSISAVGSNIPDRAIDATEFSRTEPLITVEKLKSRHLFGIPLVSPFKNPLTGKPDVLTDPMLKDKIVGAVSRLEVEMGVTLFPVQHEVRLPFDRAEYASYGYIQLPHRPILSIQSIAITTPQGEAVLSIPLEWVTPGHLQRGQINVVPIQPAFTVTGSVPSASGTGSAFISFLTQQPFIPEYWGIKYADGFDEGKIPRIINDLVGIETAIDILGMLQSLYRTSAHSLNIDGMGQSVSSPGPQVYQARITQLQEQKQMLVAKVKGLFMNKFVVGTL